MISKKIQYTENIKKCPLQRAEGTIDKIEEMRKPEDFIGHRKRKTIRNLLAGCHNTTTWSEENIPAQMSRDMMLL